MRILVTGSSGTLGAKLLTELLIRGHEVWGCDIQHQRTTNYIRADVGNYRQMERVFRTEAFDYVYHLAAEFGRINGEEYYDTLWQTNVVGTRNILELQRIFGFRLIFASSSEIYGDTFDVTLNEDLPLNQPLTQTNDYAISKWVNEQQVMNFEKRHGNECVRLRFFNCFSDDTDVLTPEGLKNIKDFKVGDLIYTLNPNSKQIEISTVIQTQKFKYQDSLISIKGIGKDFLVTPNHNMYLKFNTQTDFSFVKANKLGKSQFGFAYHKPIMDGLHPQYISLWDYITDEKIVLIRENPEKRWTLDERNAFLKDGLKYKANVDKKYVWASKNNFPEDKIEKFKHDIYVKDFMYRSRHTPYRFKTEDFIKLMAWYITEGSPGTYGQVNIPQINLLYRKEIIDLIKRIGLKPNIGKRAISFSSSFIQKYLVDECGHGCRQKRFPPFIFNLSYRLREIFFDTLMKGDGDTKGRRYTTTSERLAQDFTHLCFLNGLRAKMSEYPYEKGCFRISTRTTQSCIKPQNVSSQKYDGYVYCVTTNKNHIIYAGRSYLNWVGQSYGEGEFYHNYRSVVCLFCYRALFGIPWEVYEGYHRVFMSVDDFIPTLANACDYFKAGEVYNIGGQEYRSVKELSDLVLEYTGANPKLVSYLPEDKHNVLNKRPDIQKAMADLNHYPKITLEVGLPKTIDWMRSIYGKEI